MTNQDLKQIDDLLQERLKGFATKDDLKNFATKDDLKNLATKDDLKNFATRVDLIRMESRLEKKMGNLGKKILEAVSLGVVSKKEFGGLETRVERLEKEVLVS